MGSLAKHRRRGMDIVNYPCLTEKLLLHIKKGNGEESTKNKYMLNSHTCTVFRSV